MTENTSSKPAAEQSWGEWEYAPPPTPYDTVRDSPVMKGARLASHFIIRNILRSYNNLHVTGAKNVTGNWPCIITPNHSSHLDTLAVFAALPISYVNRICVLAAKDYFFKNSLVSFGARLMANVIPLDRSGSATRGLLICLAKLREDKSILMFPEGTRATSKSISTFKDGAIILSRKSKIPIVPTFIHGARQSMPKSAFFPRPRRVTVTFGEAVRYWENPYTDWDGLKAAADLEQRVLSLSRSGKDMEERHERP